MSLRAIYFLFLLGGLEGCGAIQVFHELEKAQSELHIAKSMRADESAVFEFTASNALLDKAQEKHAEAEVYSARDLAQKAWQCARVARRLAESRSIAPHDVVNADHVVGEAVCLPHDPPLKKIREQGAYRCAPAQLALAEAHLTFLVMERNQGRSQQVAAHKRVQHAAIQHAQQLSSECTENEAKQAKKLSCEGAQSGQQGCLDNDGDGLVNMDDICPNQPGPPSVQGCPDGDHDGIADAVDGCPLGAEDFDGFEDEDGCPDEFNSALDTLFDEDEFCDPKLDAECENADPSTTLRNQDDADGDKVINRDDICPYEAEDRDGFEDEDGCPDRDNDEDGIPDVSDVCPLEAEDFDGVDDKDGCIDGE